MRISAKKMLAIVWASPWSCLGLLLGLIAILTGGGLQWRHGVLEFHGGILRPLLQRVPILGGASAVTLGHTTLGRNLHDLQRCKDHECVHVAQYERWGPLFVPVYFLCSLWAWLTGRRAYRDNPFEREAYTKAPVHYHDDPSLS